MMKKLISCLTVLIMVVMMFATSVPVLAATPSNTLMITPDKTEAHPGDTITYTVTLGKIASIGMFQFELEFTEGLEYVANSATIPNEAALKTQLKIDESGELLDWTEVSKQLMYCILDTENSISTEIVLLKFKAKVSENATTGKKVVMIDNYTWNKPQPDYSDVPIAYNSNNSGVNVTPKPTSIAVTGVKLNKTSLSLKVGESSDLTATVEPSNATNKAVTWKSSDTSIAKVDSNGKVTAVKAGTATITVTTADGSKKATCSVAVKAAEVPVTKYNLTTSVNGGHGSVNGAQNGVEKGKTVTVVFAPDKDYEIDWVTVNGVETGVLANVLDITMNENKAVVVKYKKIGAAATEPPVTSAPTESTDPTDTSKPTDETTGSTEPTDTSAPTESTTGTPDGTESTSKPTDSTTENGTDGNKETPNSLSWLWIVPVIVVVLAGGGIAAFIIIKKKKNTQE